MSKTLLVVVGPTAVGKTTLCVELAKYYKTEIVSADSRQFYKELAIGTAKPTAKEMDGVPHHLVNNLSVSEDYNVGKYETDALAILEKLFIIKDIVILTGGSGLFIKAVCEGLDEMPDIATSLREELKQTFKEKGIQTLLEELQEKDPNYYNTVDRANHTRVIRALEIIRTTQKSYSSFRQGTAKNRPFNIIKIGLNRDRAELYERINLRMDLMLEEGLLEEVKSVEHFKGKNALRTVGYKEVFDFWEGKYNWEEALRLLKQNSRRYAKRQLTWFNKDKKIKWFHPNNFQKITQFVDEEL